MRVTELQIDDLYGTLSRTVQFHADLSLLVGINGSGKTSVLNCIEWLLKPNVSRLATTKFRRLELRFVHRDVEHTIEAVQDEKLLTISIAVGDYRPDPLTVPILAEPGVTPPGQTIEDLLSRYINLRPNETEMPAWKVFVSLPRPIVITLDRTISAEESGELFQDPYPRPARKAMSPLDRVAQLGSERYARYRSQLNRLNDELKTRIVMAALTDHTGTMPSKPLSGAQIDQLERKVLAQFPISGHEQIKRFFKTARTISVGSPRPNVRKPRNVDFFLGSYASQFQVLEGLAQAFNDFEQRATELFAPLKAYLDAVNHFLADSGKRISFDEASNKLGYKGLLDDEGSPPPPSKIQPLAHLSSGERQVLILFTFLLAATEEQLFIVDEPELSLHPKWQKDFLSEFLVLKPPPTQLLMATHSPEIVGEHKDDCIPLESGSEL